MRKEEGEGPIDARSLAPAPTRGGGPLATGKRGRSCTQVTTRCDPGAPIELPNESSKYVPRRRRLLSTTVTRSRGDR